LTLWFKAVERKERCLSQVSIRLNLPLKVLSVHTGDIEQNKIGLEPASGVQGEAIIMFFANEIFAGLSSARLTSRVTPGSRSINRIFFGNLIVRMGCFRDKRASTRCATDALSRVHSQDADVTIKSGSRPC
jgi:hypothetical protein